MDVVNVSTKIVHKGDNFSKKTYRKALVTMEQDFEFPPLPTSKKDGVRLDLQSKFEKAVAKGDLVVGTEGKAVLRSPPVRNFMKQSQQEHDEAGTAASKTINQ